MEFEYNELELIKRAQNDNSEALSQLIHHHYSFIFNYLLKLTVDSSVAEDLTQDTCFKIVQKINNYDREKASLSTWMIQIAINTCRDYYRKEKRKSTIFNFLKNDNDDSTNATQIDSSSSESINVEMMDLKSVLNKLKPEYRIPLVLKHYYGYEQKEIADLMGIPLGTVKSRLSNGLKLIRKELNNE